MERSTLTEAARRLLLDAIGSVERLDILLLMQRQAARWWSIPALADAVRIPEPLVEATLDRLASRNLVAVRIAQELLYQFSPGTIELRQVVDEIVRAHERDRNTVTAAMASPD